MEIYVPKHQEILIECPPYKTGLSGEFRIRRYDCMGNLNYDSGWGDNLIVDNGLLLITTLNSWQNYHYIGSDATPPTNGDTSLGALLAASNTAQGGGVNTNAGAPNYEKSQMQTRRFNAGVGTGTINEVGIGGNLAGTNIFARHIVTPAISKAIDEVVDVSYRLTAWPPLVDTLATKTIDGISYDTITRGCYYVSAGLSSGVLNQWGPLTTATGDWACYDGNLGAITADTPLGTRAVGTSGNVTWLSAGSGFREFEILFDLNHGNLGAGVRCATGGVNTFHRIQTQFDATVGGATVPKDATKIFTPRWKFAWARH